MPSTVFAADVNGFGDGFGALQQHTTVMMHICNLHGGDESPVVM